MKKFIAIFLLAASCLFGQEQLYSIKGQQLYSFSSGLPVYRAIFINPLANGIAGYDANFNPTTLTVGTGLSIVSGALTASGDTPGGPAGGILGGTYPNPTFGTFTSATLAAAVSDETGTGALVFGTAPTITLANGTGLPISTGVSGLATGIATFLGTPSSANLAAAMTDKTGTGVNVFATSPSLVTPSIGAATATSVNGNAFTTGTYTLTGAAGKTLTFNNSLTLAGTDATTMTFPSTSATIARTDAANTFTGNQTVGGVLNSTGTSSNSGNGLVQRFRNGYATAAQAPSATTRTYVTGSDVGPFTAGQLIVGTIIHWHLDITKTGAGVATSTFDIAYGTNGTTGDAARVSFTKPAGTAQADHCAVDIYATIKTNSASGVVIGDFTLLADQTSSTLGGFLAAAKYVSSITTTSGTFDTTSPTHVGLCITTGASDAYTINHVQAWAENL